jgi:hypothetical protein
VSLIWNIMVRNYRILFFIMLVAWFLVNLIQAAYTEILSDEAYYALYGKNLDWGYFDHPPMIALLTRFSSLFLKGNLGIRFLTVLLQPLTLLFIWKIIDEKNPDANKVFLFFIISSSICLFAILGFYTLPDVPLLFFAAFFLYSYKRYLGTQSWGDVLLLTLSMTGLLYSKYHAVLIIGFVIISNFKLLKSYKFWVAGISAIILFIPHILWQVSNDYPSIKFHLIDRAEGFRWINLIEYIPNELAVFNPFVLGAAIYIIVKVKPDSLFTRALYFQIAGFLCFFGIMTWHDHVEPQWTITSSIAMIVLIYNYCIGNPGMYRFMRRTLIPVIIVLFIARILLIAEIPVGSYFAFTGKKMKYEFIESVAKDLPVVFQGSFQKPSLYLYFTGREGFCVNSLYNRRTEFDIWQPEKKYNNKPAFIYGVTEGKSHLYEKDGIRIYGFTTDSLQTVNRIGVEFSPRPKAVYSGDTLKLSLLLRNPYTFDIDFNHRHFPVTVSLALANGMDVRLVPGVLSDPVSILRSGEVISRTFTVVVPDLSAGRYNFGVSLQTPLGPAINDSFYKIKVLTR